MLQELIDKVIQSEGKQHKKERAAEEKQRLAQVSAGGLRCYRVMVAFFDFLVYSRTCTVECIGNDWRASCCASVEVHESWT